MNENKQDIALKKLMFCLEIMQEIMAEKNNRKLRTSIKSSPGCILVTKHGGLSQQFYNFVELPCQTIRESLQNMTRLLPEGRVPISVAALRTSKVVPV